MESKDLNLLLALDAILQEQNVTKAGRRIGLSAPATSHALARIRELLDDPVLVRAGRKMVLTPRAESLLPRIRSLVEEAKTVLSGDKPFSPLELARTFTVFATDQFLLVVGTVIDRLVREEAPRVKLLFLPSTMDDPALLRNGAGDMAVCLPFHYPGEFRTRLLFKERFACVVRQDNHAVGSRLTLDDYLALEHIVVAPLGAPSIVDRALAERGLERNVVRTVPYFMIGLQLVATSDYVLTISASAAAAMAGTFRLRLLEPPLPLPVYGLNLLWHPRLDGEPANQWLRRLFLRAVKEAPGLRRGSEGVLNARSVKKPTVGKRRSGRAR
jgi:DNA-binding transcriptional LysR family regulator